jgi:hypothetical protein
MVGTRVCVSGHLSAVTSLLHDPVLVVTPGHDFDVRPHVLLAGGDEEADSIAANRLVLLGRQRDPFGARLVGALAHPLPDREDEAETLVQILDTLVDLAEQALVMRGPNLAVARLLGDGHVEPPASRLRFGRGSTLEALRRSAAQT